MGETSPAAAARAFERLVREFSSGALSTVSVANELRRVDWVSRKAVEGARWLLERRLVAAGEAVHAFSQAHQVPAEHVVRNLLGALKRESAAVVYLMLAAHVGVVVPADATWREELVSRAPRRRWRGGLALAWRLAVDQQPPRSGDLAEILGEGTETLLVASALHVRGDGEQTLDLRTRLVAHFADAAAAQASRLGRLEELWTAAELPRLPVPVIEELPPHAADAIYLSPAVRSAIFDSGVTSTGSSAPAHQTSVIARLRALDALPEALEPNITGARVPRAVLSALAPDDLPEGMARVCLRVVLRAWSSYAGSPRYADRDAARVVREDDVRSAWAGLHALVSRPPARRHQALAALPRAKRATLLRALPRAAFRDLLGAATTPDQRVTLLDAAMEAGEEQLAQLLLRDSSWLGELPAEAVPRFAPHASTQALLLAIERHGAALPFDRMPRELAQNVGKRLLALGEPDARALFTLLAETPPAVGWVMQHGGPKIRNAVLRFLEGLDDPQDSAALSRWESLVRHVLPALSKLSALVPHGISPAAFARLADLLADVRPKWRDQMLALPERAHTRPAWHAVARAADQAFIQRQSVDLPEELAAAIRASDVALGEAAREAPSLFAAEALDRLRLAGLLRHAFVSLALGRWLDSRVSLEDRQTHLAWVRDAYAATPARAAAYELALRCSLADAHRLFRFARRAAAYHRAAPDTPGCAFDVLYQTHALPKRSGGTRTITAPHPALKYVQRRILDRLLSGTPLHPAATGFRAGHSTVANAARHVGRRIVVNVDVESCFPSTRYAQIIRACRIAAAGGLSPRAIRLLAELCSYGGALPTGAPTSPALLNIVLRRIDASIGTTAARFGITYSRYADDLTFSGDGDVHRILPFVERVLGDVGFTVAKRKVNLFRRGRRQIVTGLVVNEKPNLPRRVRRRLRAAVHARVTGRSPEWHGKPINDATLLGHIANLAGVQPTEAAQLSGQVRAAMSPPAPSTDRASRVGRPAARAVAHA